MGELEISRVVDEIRSAVAAGRLSGKYSTAMEEQLDEEFRRIFGQPADPMENAVWRLEQHLVVLTDKIARHRREVEDAGPGERKRGWRLWGSRERPRVDSHLIVDIEDEIAQMITIVVDDMRKGEYEDRSRAAAILRSVADRVATVDHLVTLTSEMQRKLEALESGYPGGS